MTLLRNSLYINFTKTREENKIIHTGESDKWYWWRRSRRRRTNEVRSEVRYYIHDKTSDPLRPIRIRTRASCITTLTLNRVVHFFGRRNIRQKRDRAQESFIFAQYRYFLPLNVFLYVGISELTQNVFDIFTQKKLDANKNSLKISKVLSSFGTNTITI